MKVAVVVHNNIVRDTRVRKGIRTLVKKGVTVDVYGIGNVSDLPDTPLEGARKIVLIENNSQELGRKKKRWGLLTRLALTTFPAFALIWAILSGEPSFLIKTLRVIGVVAIFAAWLSYAFKLSLRPLKNRVNNYVGVLVRGASWRIYAKRLAAAVIQEGGYDAVWCHDIIALECGGILKRRNPSLKLIWDAHEIYEDLAYASRLQSYLQRWIISKNQKYVDAFIVINESFKRFYSKYKKLPEARIVMNATRYLEVIEEDGRLRQAAGLAKDQKILLYQGGFSEKRGIQPLLESVADLDENWSIVFMGWGKLENAIRSASERMNQGLNPERFRIILLPPAPNHELASWTSGATLGIIPYERSGLNHKYCTPNKLWEYPNAGVPFIATALDEMKKMVETWSTGFLLPVAFTGADIASLVNNLTETELAQAKENCHRFNEKNNWEVYEPEIFEILAQFDK